MKNEKRESRQPRETVSKRDFKCTCGCQVKKGNAIWYDPEKREPACINCKPKPAKK